MGRLLKFRRFLIFDVENLSKPFLEIRGDFVVPEIGSSPYRLHLVNVTKVLQSSIAPPAGKLPSAIELKDGKFSVNWAGAAKKDDPKERSNRKDGKNRVRLNSIYSKDQK